MTMRSTPPASSPLAESPVPAPPPTMGSPRAAMAWNLARRSARAKRGILSHKPAAFAAASHQGAEGGDEERGKLRFVDVAADAHDLPVARLPDRLLQRAEKRRIRLRVPEGAARSEEHTSEL